MTTLQIYLDGNNWMAQESLKFKLLPEDVRTTPFTSVTPESIVIEKLQEMRPDVEIYRKRTWEN